MRQHGPVPAPRKELGRTDGRERREDRSSGSRHRRRPRWHTTEVNRWNAGSAHHRCGGAAAVHDGPAGKWRRGRPAAAHIRRAAQPQHNDLVGDLPVLDIAGIPPGLPRGGTGSGAVLESARSRIEHPHGEGRVGAHETTLTSMSRPPRRTAPSEPSLTIRPPIHTARNSSSTHTRPPMSSATECSSPATWLTRGFPPAADVAGANVTSVQLSVAIPNVARYRASAL